MNEAHTKEQRLVELKQDLEKREHEIRNLERREKDLDTLNKQV